MGCFLIEAGYSHQTRMQSSLENLFPSIVRNSLFSTCGRLSIKAISFVFTIFIIRWFGDEDYGRYLLIWSYITIFAMFSDAGLSMYAIREIAKKTATSPTIIGNIILIRLILATLTIAVLLGIAPAAVDQRYSRALRRLRERLPESVFWELDDA